MKHKKMSASFRMDVTGIAFEKLTGLCPPFAPNAPTSEAGLVGRQDIYKMFNKTHGAVIYDLLDAVDYLNSQHLEVK